MPALEALPGDELAACFAAALRRDREGVLQYGQAGGCLPLRRLLAAQHGVSEDEIFIANGSLHLMDLLHAYPVQPGDVVLVEQPCYGHAIDTFSRRGARVTGIAMEEDGIDVDRLDGAVRRQRPAFLYTIADFQSPTGRTLSAAKRRQVTALAARHGFWVVEDIQCRALRYRGAAPPLLHEIDPSWTLGR